VINFRPRRQLLPFTVTALRQDEPLIRIGVLAHSAGEALVTARELFPQHLVATAALEPDWEDSPA
jgi:hypothetical protein